MTKKTTANLRSLIKINGELITVPTKFAPMLQAAPDLLAALKDLCAASSPYRPGHRAVLEVDGPTLESALKQAFSAISKTAEAA